MYKNLSAAARKNHKYTPVEREINELCDAIDDLESRLIENPELTYIDLHQMDEQPVYVVVDDINGFEPLTMWALIEVDFLEECIILTNNLGGRSKYYSFSDFSGLHFYKHRLRRT